MFSSDQLMLTIVKGMRKKPYGHEGYSYERTDPRTGKKIHVTVQQKGVKPQKGPVADTGPTVPEGFENHAAIVHSSLDRKQYSYRGDADKVMNRVPPNDSMHEVYSWLTSTHKFSRGDLEDRVALAGWSDKREREQLADQIISHFITYGDLSQEDIPYTEDDLGGMEERTQVTGMPEFLRPKPVERDNWESRKRIDAAALDSMPEGAVIRFDTPSHKYEYHKTKVGWHTMDLINGHESDNDAKTTVAHVSALSRAFGGQAFDVSIPGKVVKQAPLEKKTLDRKKTPVASRWDMKGFDDLQAAYRSIADNSGSGDAMNADFVEGNEAYAKWINDQQSYDRPEAHRGGETDPFNEHLNLRGKDRVTGPLEALHLFLARRKGWKGRQAGKFTWDDIDDFVNGPLTEVPAFQDAQLPSQIQESLMERKLQESGKDPSEDTARSEVNAFQHLLNGINAADGVTGKQSIDNDLGYATMGSDSLHDFLRQMSKKEVEQFSKEYHEKAKRRNAALSAGETSHPTPEGMNNFWGSDALYELYSTLGGLAVMALASHGSPVTSTNKAAFDALATHARELREALMPHFYGEADKEELPF